MFNIELSTIVTLGVIGLISFILVAFSNKVYYISLILLVGFTYYISIKFPQSFYPTISIYVMLPSALLGLLYMIPKMNEKARPVIDVEFKTNKGNKIIRDLRRGVLIFGGAGSGKTESALYTIAEHNAKNNIKTFAHDYKNGELTEMLLPIYGENLKIFSLHRPNISVRLNILNPKYYPYDTDYKRAFTVLIYNLTDFSGKGDNRFFYDSAVGIVTGTAIIFKKRYPKYCTIPHIVSFLLYSDFAETEQIGNQIIERPYEKLKNFLISDDDARGQASDFLYSAGSSKTVANILGTLGSAFSKLTTPNIFWSLSGDDIDLNLNHPDNKYSLVVLNNPKDSEIYSPVLTMLFQMITKLFMERDRDIMSLLIDEAAQFKLKNMGEIVSTMRSFGISTVYCTQDLAQGYKIYSEHEFDEIIANLGTQIFGKANYPKQAEFYEKFFEPKNILNKSTSSKGDGDLFSSNKSTTRTEREVKKVRSHEFLRFKQGQFAFLSDGNSDVIKFPKPNIPKQKLEAETEEMKALIESNYRKIIAEMKNLSASILNNV